MSAVGEVLKQLTSKQASKRDKMVPTYLPTSARHLDFNNLVGSYDSSAYPDLRGWGELSHPVSGPVASVGSWAAPTSPPAQPHNAEEADRPHEDSVKTLLISYLPSFFLLYFILALLIKMV